jgi:hypothetical protein
MAMTDALRSHPSPPSTRPRHLRRRAAWYVLDHAWELEDESHL